MKTNTAGTPPEEIKLFYRKNPKKAFSEIEENSNPLSIFAIVLPIAAGVAVTKLLGGF